MVLPKLDKRLQFYIDQIVVNLKISHLNYSLSLNIKVLEKEAKIKWLVLVVFTEKAMMNGQEVMMTSLL
jgi:hypothetical protein